VDQHDRAAGALVGVVQLDGMTVLVADGQAGIEVLPGSDGGTGRCSE
jgi:hypothetical protein